MNLAPLVRSLVIGFSIAAPVGPIGGAVHSAGAVITAFGVLALAMGQA